MDENISKILNLFFLADQMVNIPHGEIRLRDDRVQRQWTVEIESFLMCKYPVTQALYFEMTQASPSAFEGSEKPVETVSWKEAVLFCNACSVKMSLESCYSFDSDGKGVFFDSKANGYRLPTEAEWEYACKAGTNEIRYGDIEQIAWYKANSQRKTQYVGLKEPNPWGLYDMLNRTPSVKGYDGLF